MTPVEILNAALALLDVEERLAAHAYARDARGRECPIDSPRAVAWNPHGAMVRVRGESRTREGLAASRALRAAGLRDDEASFLAVTAAFRRAIAMLEAADDHDREAPPTRPWKQLTLRGLGDAMRTTSPEMRR